MQRINWWPKLGLLNFSSNIRTLIIVLLLIYTSLHYIVKWLEFICTMNWQNHAFIFIKKDIIFVL